MAVRWYVRYALVGIKLSRHLPARPNAADGRRLSHGGDRSANSALHTIVCRGCAGTPAAATISDAASSKARPDPPVGSGAVISLGTLRCARLTERYRQY